jgi:hypothetical protein
MERSDVTAMREALQTASRELGVRVITSGVHLKDTHGYRHQLIAVLPDFGGEKGMAVLDERDSSLPELAASQGLAYTVLGPTYEKYDRALSENTLNDWQWTGEGQPPAWYTGAPWTD